MILRFWTTPAVVAHHLWGSVLLGGFRALRTQSRTQVSMPRLACGTGTSGCSVFTDGELLRGSETNVDPSSPDLLGALRNPPEIDYLGGESSPK